MTKKEKPNAAADTTASQEAQPIKVLVWDLDHTLWDGVLSEGDTVRLRPGVDQVLKTLDERGILLSIASKNDFDPAMAKLQELGVDHYFLYPQIGWGRKSAAVERIAQAINIGPDTVGFVDDQPFEREEVVHGLPAVRTFDANELDQLLDQPELRPRFITSDSAIRRSMYQADQHRQQIEDDFEGPQEEFLSSLQMCFTLGPARREDLERAEELTVRTHQLNTTGYTYDYQELDRFRQSDDHLLLVAGLEDKYGTYGKIGLALIEQGREIWMLRLLLMSCRVMARGVGSVMIQYILQLAKESGARLQAEFLPTDRNRPMLVTYKFGGFREVGETDEGVKTFEHPLENLQPFPDYIEVEITDS